MAPIQHKSHLKRAERARKKAEKAPKGPALINITASFPPKFEPFLTTQARWKVVYGGRGSGKTESIAKALLLMAKERPMRILCVRETMQSIKQSSHAVLASMIGVLGLEDFYTVEQSTIYGPWIEVEHHETGVKIKKRSEFFFAGVREMSVSALKSYYDIQILWGEEAQSISKRSLRIIEPTVRRAGGTDPSLPSELWFSFNPESENDAVYERFIVDPPPDALVIELNWRDNPWFEQSGLMRDLEETKRRNHSEYLHVWEGHCLRHFAGQVYQAELEQCEKDERVCDIPYRSDAPCEVYFDIGGKGDATVLWVAQTIGDYIHVIDYHEAVQSTVDYFIKWVESKPYVVTKYWLPHDARQTHAGMTQSYEALVRAKGKKVQIVPGGRGSVAEGINALRTLFPRLRFDKTKCAKGLEHLRQYRFELEDDSKGGFKSVPVHDIHSHACDAARYMAVAFRVVKEIKTPIGKYFNPHPFRGVEGGWMSV